MRTAILGCGAMGTVLGAFLTKNGCKVDFIDSYEEHIRALNESGAKIIGTQEFTVPVNALLPEQMEGIYNLVFLFTKQTANREVLENLLPHLDADSTVCTLQNGVPEPYVAEIVGQERTVGGAVLWSATFEGPGVSNLTQNLDNLDYYFDIGEIDGTVTDRIKAVQAVLNHMGPTKVVIELMPTRWAKLVNNACMSGMSAACDMTFGQVLENDTARACVSYIGREVYQCCKAEGYQMPLLVFGYKPDSLALENQSQYDENQQMFMDMYQVVLGGKASMLQDLEKGRKTEVSMINGYVSSVGRKYGIPTPFCDKVVEVVGKIENGEIPLSTENVKAFSELIFQYEKYPRK